MTTAKLTYEGKRQPGPDERDPLTGARIYPYLPDDPLVEAVNLAIDLGRPLLIKGEPGSGKTQLARAVAWELGLPFFGWYVKSTSRARDGVYVYDAVGRLRDAQLAASGRAVGRAQIDTPMTYVRFGPLGQAFRSDRRPVLLIDEVDKADIDFPNDLLLELDERRIVIEEADGLSIPARSEPIIFVTSNDEKDLPAAFLRRCLFFYIPFPSKETLVNILVERFRLRETDLAGAAVARFLALHQRMEQEKSASAKKVSTSELIDWFSALLLRKREEVLAELAAGGLPAAPALLKSLDDLSRYGEKQPA